MKPVRLFAAFLALLSLAASSSATVPVTEFFGEITDPVGDGVRSPFDPSTDPAPDLVYASAFAAEGNVDFSVRFAPGTFAADTRIQITLDLDGDPATGFPGTTSGGIFDADVLGPEYFLNTVGSSFGDHAMLIQYTGGFPAPTFSIIADDLPVTFLSDGLDVSIPLALLEDDDGRLHFKVTTQVQITEFSTWPISDFMSNVGLQPGSTVPADEEIADLEGALEDLEDDGTLTGGPARALHNHLTNALRALDAGHEAAARAQLTAFIEQVEDLVADGTLTEDEAAPLIGAAERALAGI